MIKIQIIALHRIKKTTYMISTYKNNHGYDQIFTYNIVTKKCVWSCSYIIQNNNNIQFLI